MRAVRTRLELALHNMLSVSNPRRRRWWRRLRVLIVGSVVAYGLLLIPGREPVLEGANREPFVWDQDEVWSTLEREFRVAREAGCVAVSPIVDSSFAGLHEAIRAVENDKLSPEDDRFDVLENRLFAIGPLVGACLDRLPEYVQAYNEVRFHLKNQSHEWDMNALATRQRMYRLIYGGRAAVEELILQADPTLVPEIVTAHAEPSATPSTELFGVEVHSGDLLLSRGNTSFSALIARGQDYPGNFSHSALLHVDEDTREATVIEADIVGGVKVRPAEEFLREDKLRVLLLRMRADLPLLLGDPLLPHKAASAALQDAQTRRIPYDLEMNYRDHSRMFCSEVVLAAYEPYGVTLWTGMSFISGPGVVRWLSAAGVRNFETQEPADLEYDPQLRVVAEWRDRENLFNDHVDNAIIEVLIEAADAGERITYHWSMLPVMRILKVVSRVFNLFGAEGPVPDAVPVRGALMIREFSLRHARIKVTLLERAKAFREREGYTAPYRELLEQVREVRRMK